MAYAAVLSLAQTTAEILFPHPISQKKKQQIRSIYEPFIFLKEFLEDFPEPTNNLDGRIRDVASEAEDIIISFISRETPSHWWSVLTEKFKFKRQMRKIMRETDSITMEARNMQQHNRAAIKDPVRFGKIDYAVGLHDDLVAIKSRLCEESRNLRVIPIVGMGGIGKTTLAKSVYDDPLTVQQFDIRAWVTVSQDYNADGILSSLLASMKNFDKEGSEQSSELVGEKVFKILKGRRYLIVMDDIWSTDAWDEMRNILPDDENGSRIVLTTREVHVASYADHLSPLHQMHLMDEKQSWDLLRQRVFADKDCPSELKRIGQEIARNCGGLPLAIVVVAGLLSAVGMDPTSWKDIAENVNSSVTSKGEFQNILSLSYTHLPYYLRHCFLYMGMFPEDHEVRVSKLVKLWVAEGFFRTPDGPKSPEEEAEECLEDLVKRNLVLVTKRRFDGRIKSCSLHDLMRDLCIRRAHDEKFLLNFRSWEGRKFLPMEIRRNQPRLSVTGCGLQYLSKVDGRTTRTILCFDGISFLNLLRSFRLLRILDAEEAYVPSLPDELFELFHLVYLVIKYHGRIPAAISKLQNLQTLRVRASNDWRHIRMQSVCLLQEIWSLPQLRHLAYYGRLPDPGRTRTCSSGLENLQTLSTVSHVMCTEKILRMIPNLKALEIDCSDCRGEDEPFLNNLVYLHQLESLKLRSDVYRNAVCPKNISMLPRTLKRLTLSYLGLPWDEVTAVGSLPNLQVLKLTHHACEGSTWETTEGEFTQLEFLLIEETYLEHWVAESSHFPRLKCLLLRGCSELTQIPNGIGEIPTLELIEVKGYRKKSLVDSAKMIREEQQEWGNDGLQVRL